MRIPVKLQTALTPCQTNCSWWPTYNIHQAQNTLEWGQTLSFGAWDIPIAEKIYYVIQPCWFVRNLHVEMAVWVPQLASGSHGVLLLHKCLLCAHSNILPSQSWNNMWTVKFPVFKRTQINLKIKDGTHTYKRLTPYPSNRALPSCKCMKSRKAWILLHGTRL